MARHHVGEQVTILPPYDQDPILISMQHYGHVAEVRLTGAVMVTLPGAMPPDRQFGPFPERRIASGWRRNDGRWI
jgi:hypothetical protein